MSFHILYANESHDIIDHKNKTSRTSMERSGNASHDDVDECVANLGKTLRRSA